MFLIGLLIYTVLFKIYQKYTLGKCKCRTRMDKKVVIVTGANTGIGFETAKDLAGRGAKVILACRNEKRGLAAQELIVKETGNNDVVYKHLDLASLVSVRRFVDDFKRSEVRLDVLINNAGVFAYKRNKTEDGIIGDMQVNHFSPFLLTNLLLPMLKKGGSSRIINVSSVLHFVGSIDLKNINTEGYYGDFRTYCINKMCNVLFTVELARRLEGTGVSVNCLHPGAVNTNIFNNFGFIGSNLSKLNCWAFFKSPPEGAQTAIHLSVSKEGEQVSGKYFTDCHESWMSPKAKNRELAAKLWDYSAELVKLKPFEIYV